jgi:hypothetical protein
VLNKTHSLKHSVYLVGLHIYYKMIHGPYNIKLNTYTIETKNFISVDMSIHLLISSFVYLFMFPLIVS